MIGVNILIIGKKYIFGEGGKGYQKSARKKNYFSLRFKDSICAKSKKSLDHSSTSLEKSPAGLAVKLSPAAGLSGIRRSAEAEFACPDDKIRKTICETVIFLRFRSKIDSSCCFAAPWTKTPSFFPNSHGSEHNRPTNQTVPDFFVRLPFPVDWAFPVGTIFAANRASLIHHIHRRPW